MANAKFFILLICILTGIVWQRIDFYRLIAKLDRINDQLSECLDRLSNQLTGCTDRLGNEIERMESYR